MTITVTVFWSPLPGGEALDVIEWRLVHLFHHSNYGEFLLLPLESRQCDTIRYPTVPILLSLPVPHWKPEGTIQSTNGK
jgi:hypothetical protein